MFIPFWLLQPNGLTSAAEFSGWHTCWKTWTDICYLSREGQEYGNRVTQRCLLYTCFVVLALASSISKSHFSKCNRCVICIQLQNYLPTILNRSCVLHHLHESIMEDWSVHLNNFLPDYFIFENPQRKSLDCIILLQRLHGRNKCLLQSLILTDRKFKQRFRYLSMSIWS